MKNGDDSQFDHYTYFIFKYDNSLLETRLSDRLLLLYHKEYIIINLSHKNFDWNANRTTKIQHLCFNLEMK